MSQGPADPLFRYYERELRYFRDLASAFQERYPAMANALQLDSKVGSADPLVQHLIQAFALIAARVHHKLDDEFPELTDALLGVLYPHFLAPVPSCAVVQFVPSPGRPSPPQGTTIERGARLESTQKINDVACQYRTCYPVTLWPLEVDRETRLTPAQSLTGVRPPAGCKMALRLRLRCAPGQTFAALNPRRLRFFLAGDLALTARLYELIFHATQLVQFRPLDGAADGAVSLRPAECLFPVGYGRDEGLLPYPPQSFLGYRTLTEFFAFPEKFLFFDLGGWERLDRKKFAAGADVLFFVESADEDLVPSVRHTTFLLGCTPAVNLFGMTAEAVPLTQNQFSYPLVPDHTRPRDYEIYSVDSVYHRHPETLERDKEYRPFFSFRHAGKREPGRAFWYMSRRPSVRKDDGGTDVFMHLVDLDFDPRLPAETMLTADVTCTNRNLPVLLREAGEHLRLELKAQAPAENPVRCPVTPTPPLRPPLRRGAYWRLVSHLSLNHLTLDAAAPEESAEALREMLRLYDFSDPAVSHQQADVNAQLIEGILKVAGRPAVHRSAVGFVRGTDVEVTFDADKYVGTGLYLFACVLECFLGLYTSINSSTRLVAATRQGRRYDGWPPRAGEHRLL